MKKIKIEKEFLQLKQFTVRLVATQ